MISLAMIVKNSEKDLQRLIPKIKQYFQEIVIVDTGSTDNTVKVAKELDCKVFIEPFPEFHNKNGEFDFASARNSSFDKCSNEWVFWLDDDDDVTGLENLHGLIQQNVDGVFFKYNYARDEYGNIMAVQWRERLLRREKFTWKGTVHETAISDKPTRVIKSDEVVVDHLADISKMTDSNKRNIRILEAEVAADGDKSDPRSYFYIAQTYRGLHDWRAAAKYYVMYLKVSGWEEEKMQAWHFLADCLRFQGDYDAALLADHEALKIKPDWPDGYFGLGDTYFYMGDKFGKSEHWHKAIEWIKMGFSKPTPDTTRVIEPNRYTWMPLLQLAIAQLNIGEVQDAYKNYMSAYKLSNKAKFVSEYLSLFQDMIEQDNAKENLIGYMEYLKDKDPKKLKNIESIISDSIGDNPEVLAMKNAVVAPKAWDKKSIVIFCATSYEYWAAPSVIKGIGGSEEAVIYISQEFTKLGYKVTVYNNCGPLRGTYDGVDYRNVWELNPNDDFNIFISWRNPYSFNDVKAKVRWVWLHDVPEPEVYTEELLKNIDKVVVLSDYHRSLLPNVPDNKIFVSNNGIVPDQFPLNPVKKPHSIFWGSSYDRGLQCLLKDIYPIVKKEVPDTTLNICYGWDTFDEMNKNNPDALKWKEMMVELMKQEGITHLGRISHKKLAKLMSESMVWAYPTEFTEINCITAQKVQCAGCVPVTTDVAALKETNRQGIFVQTDKIYSQKNRQLEFAKKVIEQLKNPKKIDQKAAIAWSSWTRTANNWIKEWNTKTSNS